MEIINFQGYEFNPKSIRGKVECPKELMARMVNTVLNVCPDNVEVKEYANTTSITLGSKKVNISVWRFALADYPSQKPFNDFHTNGSDTVIVFGIQTYESNKFVTGNSLTSQRFALGFRVAGNIDPEIGSLGGKASENRAMFMLKTKVYQYANAVANKVIKLFMAEENPLIDLVIAKMPDDAKISKTKLSMRADFNIDENSAFCQYDGKTLYVEVQHEYDETDTVYGSQFMNYQRSIQMSTAKEIEAFDWGALWKDLYENRQGTVTRKGSLGT
jgi:hypothetical protein